MNDLEVFREFLSYDPETGEIRWVRTNSNRVGAGELAGTRGDDKRRNGGYIQIRLNGKIYRAHRVAWLLHYGVWPKDQIDHINGIRDDNRICNLREVTNRENSQNMSYHRNGNLVGAHFHEIKKKWVSCIQIDGVSRKLGSFNTQIEAHNAYMAALRDPSTIPPSMEEIRQSKGRLRGCKYDKRRNVWIARCYVNNKERYLGVFETEAEAHAAWEKAQSEPPPPVETALQKALSGKIKGATFSKQHKKWVATITITKKRFHLGLFDTAEEASAAFTKALKEKEKGRTDFYADWH